MKRDGKGESTTKRGRISQRKEATSTQKTGRKGK
jgi:hypothetical protein